jgi:tetratricopeptide (TPR) repeat protein
MNPCRSISAFASVILLAGPAQANPASEALRQRAFEAAYNLDHERARNLFEQAIAADPGDPAAYRGLASIAWLNLVFRRGAVTVDHYLGRISKPNIDLKKPPPELAALFQENVNRALALAEQRARANPRDLDARYHVGAAVGLLASYTATVDGKLLSAFRAARRAYNEHEEILRLDPQRKNAALIVGMYRYIVSAFSLPVRWMAHIAGFGGGKARGLQLLEEAAAYPSDVQTDARFVLIVLYNRERRYDDALRLIRELQRLYPRNRLLWLEAGATALRAGRPAEAEQSLDAGLTRLQDDHRPRMPGEESLWYFKRGAARLALRNLKSAASDLDRALEGEVQPWVRGRVHVERGRLADLAGDPARARAEYDRALAIFKTTNDPAGERDARRLRESRPAK